MNKGKKFFLDFYIKVVKNLFNEKKYNEVYVNGLGACLDLAIEVCYYLKLNISNVEINNISSSSILVKDKKTFSSEKKSNTSLTNNTEQLEVDTEVICKECERYVNLITIKLVKINKEE